MDTLWIIVAVIAILAIWAILIYNSLVTLKHNVARSWANIDVLLKQRHDELPKLVEACRQYAAFEQGTLERVTAARARVHSAREASDIAALGAAETELRAGLGRLLAVAESYPELRANESFMQLIERVTALENAIADRRELYNDAVNINNVRIEQFPDVIVARLLGFGEQTLLRFSEAEKRDVDMKALFA
ncbi:MAG TPA: LemA family protein [Rhodocyclaceae bacterium]|nr:LemA family protein [Rhodocyclaceae bacterium]